MVQSSDKIRAQFASRLKAAIRHANIPSWGAGARLADITGTTPKADSKWLNADTMPARANMRSLAKALRVREEWLQYGVGDMLYSDQVGPIGGNRPPDEAINPPDQVEGAPDPQDVIESPYVSVRPSMGHGHGEQEEEVIRLIELSRNWLTSKFHITSPQNIAILTAYGRSMAPTFNDGDTLVVDRGITVADSDDVYVIEREGELYIKRIARTLTGAVKVISDNPKFPSYDVPRSEFETLRVLGRVVTALDWKEV